MTDDHIPTHDECPYCHDGRVEEYRVDNIEGTFDSDGGRVCIVDHDDGTHSIYVHTGPGE